MDRYKEIQRTMYGVVVLDVALVLMATLVVLREPSLLIAAAAVCLPCALIFNALILRRKMKTLGPPVALENVPRSRTSSLYVGSAIFCAGTLYGLVAFSEGELPRIMLPILLVPLTLAIWCFRSARRADT